MGLARLKDPRGWGASVAGGARDPEWRLAERPGERDLFVRGLGGDASAYREFLRGTAHALRGFIGRYAGSDPDEVEALVQECLLAIHARRHTWLQRRHEFGARAAHGRIGAGGREQALDLLAAHRLPEGGDRAFRDVVGRVRVHRHAAP